MDNMFTCQPIKKSDVNKILKKIKLMNQRNQIMRIDFEKEDNIGGPITQSVKITMFVKNVTDDLTL